MPHFENITGDNMNENFDDFNPELYHKYITESYARHLKEIPNNSTLFYIYGQCGKVYDEIFNLNIDYALWKNQNEFDHTLVYLIAGWVKDNVKNDNLTHLSQKQVAEGVTKQILSLIQCDKVTQMKYNERIKMIYATYLSEIPRNSNVSYIYSLSGKIYDEITNLNVQVDLWDRTSRFDPTLVYLIAGWVKDNIKNINLTNFSQKQIAEGITNQLFSWLEFEEESSTNSDYDN